MSCVWQLKKVVVKGEEEMAPALGGRRGFSVTEWESECFRHILEEMDVGCQMPG